MTNRRQGIIRHKQESKTSGPHLPTKTPTIFNTINKMVDGPPVVITTHLHSRLNEELHHRNTVASRIEDSNRDPRPQWSNKVPAKGTRTTTHRKRSVDVTTPISVDLHGTHNSHTTTVTVNLMNRLKELARVKRVGRLQ
jgi:hypothetical protein